jgi:peptidyl-tRNA hydrolase
MRRVFIIRKDLHLKAGKLAAMVGHCCEAYWTNLLKANSHERSSTGYEICHCDVEAKIWDDYVNGIFTKTICEARNINQLKKIEIYINDIKSELGIELVEGIDWGYINDNCLTDLTPENPDGTCTIGAWFKPLPDDIAHRISKKFPLYQD